MCPADPVRLNNSDGPAAALLSAYVARTGAPANDEAAAWQRLQPVLDARLPRRRWPSQTRVLAGAFTLALGLLSLVRSVASWEQATTEPGTARRATNDATLGSGGASGAVDGDSRGIGGMEGATGAGHASDGA